MVEKIKLTIAGISRVVWHKKEIIGGVLIVIMFGTVAYYMGEHRDALYQMIGGPFGYLMYVVLTIIAVIIPPFTTLVLYPVATLLWGPPVTIFLTVTGYVIGSMLVFEFGKSLLQPIARRWVRLDDLHDIIGASVGKYFFWKIVLLRMFVPVSPLSYAISIFLPMPLATYTAATIIGVLPFTIVFSYAASFSFLVQMVSVMVAVTIGLSGLYRVRKALRAHAASPNDV
ncbi:MAG: hypothetical protein COW88_01165 [Candidatus Lloydbacteria bacterium CG22_combo_CG10-13_8_21_14_all_47_15]|uniref:TVP38/TMEM64 family membrane protein n=1 Tax=Candidatus Lloydbacteria bacterium CG22_combo_CG10-13_8_21_14_all_47_15 TaxID=1974635 RepID=A0A2H0CUR5_9BACT|nr:MAG: hypothetical protein COW88_01165 [Candidatus Lloydbacteria bacterium CG22_combo_CG10-13_8_21_14_all_47_15]